MERFWSKVDIKEENDCWKWIGCETERGYGAFGFNGTTKLAHRVAYEISSGPIPRKICCLHKCDNKLCVNPNHLYLGTQGDNMVDRFNRNHSNQGGHSKLHPGEVWLIRKIYSETSLFQKDIALMFKTSQSTICRITKGFYHYDQ